MKSSDQLRLLTAFRSRPVLTLPEIQKVLGGVSAPTARRRLRVVPYRSSYSHNSRYYTFFEESKFDRWGLWSHEGIRVSREGSLTATVRRLVIESKDGWTRRELREILGVPVQTVLNTLRERGEIKRQRVGPAFVYVSAEHAESQIARREERLAAVQRRSEAPLEVVVAVLLVVIQHPKSTTVDVVRRLKGHSPAIHIQDVEEVFDRYDIGEKKTPPNS
jgi:hypothetical protein